MFDFEALAQSLDSLGLGHWNEELGAVLHDRLTGKTHGDWKRWNAAIEALPNARNDSDRLCELLMGLHPWRKGPLTLGSIEIDTEWRSDWKWARLKDAIAPLDGRRVLDVGSGNGYYALKMREAGAAMVIGVDPTLLFAMQFQAINVFAQDPAIFILPLRLEETPPITCAGCSRPCDPAGNSYSRLYIFRVMIGALRHRLIDTRVCAMSGPCRQCRCLPNGSRRRATRTSRSSTRP
jgi:tRNA (mo5U34)-methyltransferase